MSDLVKLLSPTQENLRLAADELINGNLVAFPTETVYGLAGNAYDDTAVARVFSLKKRPQNYPLSVCYRSLEQASVDVFINDFALLVAKHFLPGPITLLLKHRTDSKISKLCSAGTETIGIRIPAHPVALELLSFLSFPLTATSANLSKKTSPKLAEDVADALAVDALTVIDGGCCSIGIESTILDLSGDIPKILRVGAIDKAEIFEKCNNFVV
jgi:L-threonylcarbamoyladenylate synthase